MSRLLNTFILKSPYIALFFTVFFAGILSHSAFSTHIRAGEIIARRTSCSSLTYSFQIVGYVDLGSDVEFGNGEINFGDGSPNVILDTEAAFTANEPFPDRDDVGKTTFTIEHTFPGPGRYTISFREFNRNADVLNMASSVNTPFYIETVIVIDFGQQCNNSPELLIPPIDGGCIGTQFVHSPGGFDPDGDSLAYRFIVRNPQTGEIDRERSVIPKQNRDLPVDDYTFPTEYDINRSGNNPIKEDGSTPVTIEQDPETGLIVWNAPGSAGEYNIAFIVEEYRFIDGQWVQLGAVTRDMQIIIEDCENEPPELQIPPDTCVIAGDSLLADISAVDPDGHPMRLEAFGGVFDGQFISSPATFEVPAELQNSPAFGTFSWLTNCSHVRSRAYQIDFKATDDPPSDAGPPLADLQSWSVDVLAPPPENLEVEADAQGGITLNWDAYQCFNGIDQAESIEIYRRIGNSEYMPDACQTGIPESAGYELVATVDAGVVSYRDTNGDERFAPGANYCYRLLAVYPEPGGGESIASEEICIEIMADAPVILNADISVTSETDGEVEVRWLAPFEIDKTLFPPPYQYELYRSTGYEKSGAAERVTTINSSDTLLSFTDTGLNTRNEIYNYFIYLNQVGTGERIDSSAVASTVRLSPTSEVGTIRLDWQANVPWSNNSPRFPVHFISRNRVDPDNPDAVLPYDTVNVLQASSVLNGRLNFTYVDDGAPVNTPLSDQLQYCYVVTTQGTYENDTIPEPLLNASQLVCAQPNDTIPPCEPVSVEIPDATLDSDLCSQTDIPCITEGFSNTIRWTSDNVDGCGDDIRSYNIYFTPQQGKEYALIGNTESNFFVHDQNAAGNLLESQAGCYYITAIDRSGNESVPSDTVCNDNCPSFRLPNVFTPDDDGFNDVFPYSETTFNLLDRETTNEFCPRFVRSVEFIVYNRWGNEVFTYNSRAKETGGIFIEWDGKSNNGTELSAGVYYYEANVRFIRLRPEDEQQTITGYIQLMRADRNASDSP